MNNIDKQKDKAATNILGSIGKLPQENFKIISKEHSHLQASKQASNIASKQATVPFSNYITISNNEKLEEYKYLSKKSILVILNEALNQYFKKELDK